MDNDSRVDRVYDRAVIFYNRGRFSRATCYTGNNAIRGKIKMEGRRRSILVIRAGRIKMYEIADVGKRDVFRWPDTYFVTARREEIIVNTRKDVASVFFVKGRVGQGVDRRIGKRRIDGEGRREWTWNGQSLRRKG